MRLSRNPDSAFGFFFVRYLSACVITDKKREQTIFDLFP